MIGGNEKGPFWISRPNHLLQTDADFARLSKTFARPQTVVRTGRRVSHAGCARLRRSNQRMEPMALRATAHPPPR